MYNLSQSRTHILDIPEIKGKRICGSSHGWLVLEKEREVSLFNPFTRGEISLPSLSVQPNSFQGNTKGTVIHSTRRFCIVKAILSSNPRTDSNCLVMALFADSWKTAFCRIGDECWTTVFVEGNAAPESLIVNIGYRNNLFYAICDNVHVWICNTGNHQLYCVSSLLPVDEESCTCTVVEGSDEHGLMVLLWKCQKDKFFLLMLSEEQKRWLTLDQEHSGSNIFFLGGLFHSIAVPTANLQLDGWEGGSICYVRPQIERMVGDENQYSFNISRYRRTHDRSVLTTLASRLQGFSNWNEKIRYLRSPSFLWLIPTLSPSVNQIILLSHVTSITVI